MRHYTTKELEELKAEIEESATPSAYYIIRRLISQIEELQNTIISMLDNKGVNNE